MGLLTATVRGGRLVPDEPLVLPEGTIVELTVRDDGDSLGDDERMRLHAAIEESRDQAARGQARDAKEVIAALRAKRS